jgi:hypothetical protein
MFSIDEKNRADMANSLSFPPSFPAYPKLHRRTQRRISQATQQSHGGDSHSEQ